MVLDPLLDRFDVVDIGVDDVDEDDAEAVAFDGLRLPTEDDGYRAVLGGDEPIRSIDVQFAVGCAEADRRVVLRRLSYGRSSVGCCRSEG